MSGKTAKPVYGVLQLSLILTRITHDEQFERNIDFDDIALA